MVQVLHSLYSRFIKQEVNEEDNGTSKLSKPNPKDSKIWCDLSKVDIGVGVNIYIKKGVIQREITEKQRKSFKEDRIKFLSSMVSKLAQRSPLNYKIIAAVSASDPSFIISIKVNAQKKFKNLVEILYERDWITFILADNAKLQFCSLPT